MGVKSPSPHSGKVTKKKREKNKISVFIFRELLRMIIILANFAV